MMAKLARMMIACDEATYLASKSRDNKLNFKERMNLRIHLLSCKYCLRYARDIRILDEYFQKHLEAGKHHHLNSSEKKRIKTRVLKELK